ncbi:unnamed protein product [Calypogeia fissa]
MVMMITSTLCDIDAEVVALDFITVFRDGRPDVPLLFYFIPPTEMEQSCRTVKSLHDYGSRVPLMRMVTTLIDHRKAR